MGDVLAAGLIIRVKDQATRILGVIGRGFQRLRGAANQIKSALVGVGQAFTEMRTVGLALAGALGFMAVKASAFEQQMSAVQSVLLAQADDPAFRALGDEIKRLGATTSFSATQAAQGAEFLSRAGFTATEQIEALGGVLAAAAADSLDLASTANIVANTVRGFGLEAGDAALVADTLAITSARTNTNISQLGEGMKFVAPIARGLGVDVKDTALALGLLANAGLQGSIGGTALKNMLLKLSTANDKVKGQFNNLGIQIQDASGNMLPFRQILGSLAQALPKIGGNLKQTAFLAEAFGLRGQVAAGNLSVALTKMSKATVDGESKWAILVDQIQNAEGAAKKMAKIRLDNLRGQATLLASAVEGVSIELFSIVSPAIRDNVKTTTEVFSLLAQALQSGDLESGNFIINMEDIENVNTRAAFGIFEFARGLKQGAERIAEWIDKANEFRIAALNAFGFQSGGSLASLGKFVAIGTVVAVVLGGLAIVAKLLVIPIILFVKALVVGAASIIIAFLPVIIVMGLIALIIQKTRKEGQSFGDRFTEVFTSVKDTAMRFFAGFKAGFDQFIKPSFDVFMVAIADLGAAFDPIFAVIAEQFGGVSKSAGDWGALMAIVVGGIVDMLTFLVAVMAPIIKFVIEDFVAPFIRGILQIANGFNDLISGSVTMGTALKRIFKGVANVLLNTVFRPFKVAILGIIEAAAAIGAVEESTAKSVRAFLNAEPGTFLGEDIPEKEGQRAALDANNATKAALDADQRAKEAANTSPEVNIGVKPGDQTLKGKIKTEVKVAGQPLAVATAIHEFELSQRGGFKLNVFQEGQIFANGGLN